MRGPTLGAAIGAGALLTAGFAACTTFDGLVATLDEDAPIKTGAGGGGAGGGGGGGGKAGAGGGSGADAGPPAAPGFLSQADAVRLCKKVATCPQLALSTIISTGVPVDALQFSSCVSWAAGPLPLDHQGSASQATFLSCIAKAKGCSEALGCLWYEAVTASDPRCLALDAGPPGPDGPLGVCQGKTTVNLCPYAIQHCDNAFWGKGAGCSVEPKSGISICTVPGGCLTPSCNGDQLSTLCTGVNKPNQIINCAATGGSCGADSLGQFNCLSNGTRKECLTAQPGAVCDDDIVSVCNGFSATEYRCASLGAVCDESKGTARCKLPSDACSPFDTGIDSCKGSVISLCVGGQRSSFDCASVGLTCKAGSNGQSGRCD